LEALPSARLAFEFKAVDLRLCRVAHQRREARLFDNQDLKVVISGMKAGPAEPQAAVCGVEANARLRHLRRFRIEGREAWARAAVTLRKAAALETGGPRRIGHQLIGPAIIGGNTIAEIVKAATDRIRRHEHQASSRRRQPAA